MSTIAATLEAHRAGASPEDTIAQCYARIRAHNDPAIFITLRDEADARAEARALAAKGDTALPLYGVPFAVKDNIDVAGLPTTAACPAFAYTAKADATCVARLRAAGAIPDRQDQSRPVRHRPRRRALALRRAAQCVRREAHPRRIELGLGGRCGGGARAVRRSAPTRRAPAACRPRLGNIVGLKPSLGVVSTAGVVPACRTLDCVSVFALTVDDAWAALRRDGGAGRRRSLHAQSRARRARARAAKSAHRRADQGRARVLRRSGVGRANSKPRSRASRSSAPQSPRSTSSRSTKPRGCSTKARGSPSAIWRRRR